MANNIGGIQGAVLIVVGGIAMMLMPKTETTQDDNQDGNKAKKTQAHIAPFLLSVQVQNAN